MPRKLHAAGFIWECSCSRARGRRGVEARCLRRAVLLFSWVRHYFHHVKYCQVVKIQEGHEVRIRVEVEKRIYLGDSRAVCAPRPGCLPFNCGQQLWCMYIRSRARVCTYDGGRGAGRVVGDGGGGMGGWVGWVGARVGSCGLGWDGCIDRCCGPVTTLQALFQLLAVAIAISSTVLPLARLQTAPIAFVSLLQFSSVCSEIMQIAPHQVPVGVPHGFTGLDACADRDAQWKLVG